jgi:hypothetical protein
VPGRHDVRRGEGVLAFEQPGGGSDLVGAPKIAPVLAKGRIPVVVLNACLSRAVGKTGLIPPGIQAGFVPATTHIVRTARNSSWARALSNARNHTFSRSSGTFSIFSSACRLKTGLSSSAVR